MKGIFLNKKLLGLISIFLVVVAATGLWLFRPGLSVEASGVVSIDIGPGSGIASALDTYSTSTVSEKSPNYFEIDYPGSGSKIEIGDASKTDNFKPDLTISTWNREAEFKLISLTDIEEKSQLTTSLDGDTISASNGEWTFEYQPTTPKEGFNDKGGIDILITAKEKPASNKIYFTYDSSTVTPYYQAPLTGEYQSGWNDEFQCEISVTETQVVVAKDSGELKAGTVLDERPDYVVGSIAFYADGKANHVVGGVNYATGKVGHLYAMQCNGEWCRWSIEGQYIVLTIPHEIYDQAVYPIAITPVGDTFGYTSAGQSSSGTMNTMITTYGGYTAAAGECTQIDVYTKSPGDNTACALYKVSDDTLLTNGSTGVEVSADDSWVSYGFSSNPTLAAVDYYLVFNSQTWCNIGYDSSAPAGNLGCSDTFGNWMSPASWSQAQTYREFSIYATYTTGSSPSISNTPSSATSDPLGPSDTFSTGLNYFTVTNNSGSAVNITISGTDITGGIGWALSDTGTPGVGTAGIKAGLDGGAYDIIVKKTAPYNTLKSNLAASASQDWGLQLLAPTNYTDSVQKAVTVTLTATVP